MPHLTRYTTLISVVAHDPLFLRLQELNRTMKHFGIPYLLLFFMGLCAVSAQISPDCGTAVPICNNTPVNGGTVGYGIDDFNGEEVSGCLEKTLSGFIESNSAWYRFRTGASGQLGFNIGFDASEDWDFALYKTDDCNNLGEPVRCNFFDNSDANSYSGVGVDPSGGAENFQYEDWLEVLPGEDYYLLINNFSNTNSGFSIQFSGSIFSTNPYDALDCSIINNLLGPPISSCEGETVILDATTATAVAYSWFSDSGTGFQPIVGESGNTLSVNQSALYRVMVVTPTGTIISDVQVAFSPAPTSFPMTDAASCEGFQTYDLSQKDAEALGSQDPSEFVVSYYASLGDANNAANMLPKMHPTILGTQTIFVRVASIDNPNCYDVSEQFQLINLESPNMDFPSEASLCVNGGTVTIGFEMAEADYAYLWDNGAQTAQITVSQPGSYTLTATHVEGNLSCSDTKTVLVTVSDPPEIANIEIDDLQNNNTVTITTTVQGNFEYQLDGGAFQGSSTFSYVSPGPHTVTVNDIGGCGAVSEEIVVVGFAKFFTPNGDNNNDTWHISGVDILENPEVFIYDRYGKLIKYIGATDTFGWDGAMNGKALPESDYWFKLTYTSADGQRVTAKYINNHFALKR